MLNLYGHMQSVAQKSALIDHGIFVNLGLWRYMIE
jgi:hypothetical protein